MYYVFPNNFGKKIIKIGRLVVKPDYQGIGIGLIISNFLGEYADSIGYELAGQSSNPAIIEARRKSPNWKITRYGRIGKGATKSNFKSKIKTEETAKNANNSGNRITASFKYVPNGTRQEENTTINQRCPSLRT